MVALYLIVLGLALGFAMGLYVGDQGNKRK
jgi:hypothetical protein